MIRLLAAIAVALLLACLASAAPLPFAKARPPAPAPGVYRCWWNNSESALDIRLYPGGRYEGRATIAGPVLAPLQWVGEWTQDGPTLNVCERSPGASGTSFYVCRWSVGPSGATINGNPADIWLERVR